MDFVRDLIYSIDTGLVRLNQTDMLTHLIAFTEDDLYELKEILLEYERIKERSFDDANSN